MPVLQERIDTWTPVDPGILERQVNGSAVKQSVVKALEFLGLDESTRKMWRRSRRALLKEMPRRENGEGPGVPGGAVKLDSAQAAYALSPTVQGSSAITT